MAVQFKKLTATLSAGEVNYTFTDALINDASVIEVYTDNDDVYPVDLEQDGNNISIKFSNHDAEVGIALTINNVVTYEPTDISGLEDEIQTVSDNLSGLTTVVNELSDNVDNIEGDVSTLGTMVTDLETSKQDVLIAGENITIENNVISSIGGGSSQDIYSIDEVLIGTWLGKNLYRKLCTISSSSISVSSSGATITFTNETYPTNADKIINARYTNNAHVMFNFTQFSRETYPQFYATASPSVTIRNTGYIILEYTKVGE